MSELWSGVLGAAFGGVLGGAATFLAVWWQTSRLLNDERERAREARAEERRDWMLRREEQALASLLVILNKLQTCLPVLYALSAHRSMGARQGANRTEAKSTYDALLRGLRVDLPLVSNVEIRQRFYPLVGLVDEWAYRRFGDDTNERERWRGDLIRYIGYVRYTIKNALHGRPLPSHVDPPVLSRQDSALWTPPEMDPEDSYFPEARPKL